MFVASLIMVCVGLLKTKKQILIWQTIQISLMGVASIFLGSIPGLIANLVGVTRNLFGYYNKLTRGVQLAICGVAIASTLLFNNIGWLGILPITAAVWYTLCMNTTDVKKLKWLIAGTLVLWLIHDVAIQSYVSAAFNMFSVVTCVIGIFRKENSDGNSTHQEN
jgi:hypothetical protein